MAQIIFQSLRDRAHLWQVTQAWELDPGQPRVDTGAFRRFRQTVNLGRTAKRLDRLLQDFEFGPLREMIHV